MRESNLDIIAILLVIMVFSCLSFLIKICVGFKGFLFLINFSLKLSFLLLSSYGYFACFFFSYGYAPFSGNHF